MSIPSVDQWASVAHWGMFSPSGEGPGEFTLDPQWRTGEFNEGGGSLPAWIARLASGDASKGEIVWRAYSWLITPDARGNLMWGTELFPFDGGNTGNPSFFNVLPPVMINGRLWNRTGEPLASIRGGVEGGAYEPILKRVPATLDYAYDPQYGYIVPDPIYRALMPIAAMKNAGGGWADMLPMIFFSAVTGATLGAAFAEWAGSGFGINLSSDFTGAGFVTDIPGSFVTNIPGGSGMGDDWLSLGLDYGSDWSGLAPDSTDYLYYDYGYDPAGLGLDYGSDWSNLPPDSTPYLQSDPDITKLDPFEVDGSAQALGNDQPVYKLTQTADVEDADLGKAMKELKAKGSDFNWQKTFVDNAGKLFKLVQGTNAAGQPTIRPTAITLPNGQQAIRLPSGQIVGANSSAGTAYTSSLSSLPSWLIPAALGVTALFLGS